MTDLKFNWEFLLRLKYFNHSWENVVSTQLEGIHFQIGLVLKVYVASRFDWEVESCHWKHHETHCQIIYVKKSLFRWTPEGIIWMLLEAINDLSQKYVGRLFRQWAYIKCDFSQFFVVLFWIFICFCMGRQVDLKFSLLSNIQYSSQTKSPAFCRNLVFAQ